MKIEAMRCYV